MRALVFDGESLRLRSDHPEPVLRDGWAVIRMTRAGVCRTDVEITRGYMGFQGVLGHELLGVVADDRWSLRASCPCAAVVREVLSWDPRRVVLHARAVGRAERGSAAREGVRLARPRSTGLT